MFFLVDEIIICNKLRFILQFWQFFAILAIFFAILDKNVKFWAFSNSIFGHWAGLSYLTCLNQDLNFISGPGAQLHSV
jgi:hypothetical protein